MSIIPGASALPMSVSTPNDPTPIGDITVGWPVSFANITTPNSFVTMAVCFVASTSTTFNIYLIDFEGTQSGWTTLAVDGNTQFLAPDQSQVNVEQLSAQSQVLGANGEIFTIKQITTQGSTQTTKGINLCQTFGTYIILLNNIMIVAPDSVTALNG